MSEFPVVVPLGTQTLNFFFGDMCDEIFEHFKNVNFIAIIFEILLVFKQKRKITLKKCLFHQYYSNSLLLSKILTIGHFTTWRRRKIAKKYNLLLTNVYFSCFLLLFWRIWKKYASNIGEWQMRCQIFNEFIFFSKTDFCKNW